MYYSCYYHLVYGWFKRVLVLRFVKKMINWSTLCCTLVSLMFLAWAVIGGCFAFAVIALIVKKKERKKDGKNEK